MKKITTLILFVLFAQFLYANDGAFFASGNQLVPIEETGEFFNTLE